MDLLMSNSRVMFEVESSFKNLSRRDVSTKKVQKVVLDQFDPSTHRSYLRYGRTGSRNGTSLYCDMPAGAIQIKKKKTVTKRKKRNEKNEI